MEEQCEWDNTGGERGRAGDAERMRRRERERERESQRARESKRARERERNERATGKRLSPLLELLLILHRLLRALQLHPHRRRRLRLPDADIGVV
eukprot:COSAG05_NODE_4542_length_1470_cov_166.561504_2_plen_95_part_00